MTAWTICLLTGLAGAGPSLPDYRSKLNLDYGQTLAELNGSGRYRESIQMGGRIQRSVDRFPRVSYEIGYAHYQLGELDAAVRNYDTALRQDPELTMARYDRGEIHLLEGRLKRAREDFMAVVTQTPTHWAGHFRMAHIAGLASEAEAFEEHIMSAIQHGFQLASVRTDPDWNAFAQHSTLRPVLRKIIVLYGDDELRKWIGEGI